MATIEELYNEILANKGARKAFAEAAATPEGLVAYLADKGCDATPEEVGAFLKEMQSRQGELSEAELESVAGGCNGEEAMCSIMSVGVGCAISAIASVCGDGEGLGGPDGRLLCYCPND